MEYTNNILLWGTGLPGMVEKFSLCKLYKASSVWANTFENFKPWLPISLTLEDTKHRCWISKHPDIEDGLIIVGPCSSCLDVAWYFYKQGFLPIFHSVVALRQWAGRGQLGRNWYSPLGNLYAAWHLPLPERKGWEEVISLVIGYVAVEMLIEIGIGAQLKWPNDLLIDRKKVGGILIEQRERTLIAGIGINLILCPDRDYLRDTQALSATCLRDHGLKITPMEFWLRLTKHGKPLYERIMNLEALSEVVSLIEKHLAFMEERVKIHEFAR